MRKFYQPASVFFQIVLWVFPWTIRRRLLSAALGYKLAGDSRVGLSIILATKVRLKSGSRIGHFTVIRNLNRLVVDEFASIGNFNKIGGVLPSDNGPFSEEANRRPELILKRHASITNSHIVDCTNQVLIEEFATVAGWRSQILTHAIDFNLCRQRSAPVAVKAYSFVGTGCILLRGAVLPERSALAAGSVLATHETEALHVYSGVPATKSKQLKEGAAYFSRQTGRVK